MIMTDSHLIPDTLMARIREEKPGMSVRINPKDEGQFIFRCCDVDMNVSADFIEGGPEQIVFGVIMEGFNRYIHEEDCVEGSMDPLEAAFDDIRETIPGCTIFKINDDEVKICSGLICILFSVTGLENSRRPGQIADIHIRNQRLQLGALRRKYHDFKVRIQATRAREEQENGRKENTKPTE